MNKKIYLITGGVLVIALLAGGAFMAMRLLNSNGLGSKGSIFAGLGSLGKFGGGNAKSFRIELDRAPEVPEQAPDLSGQVAYVKDNSFFIGTNEQNMTIAAGEDDAAQPTPEGPYTEIVVTKDTKIWRDITLESVPKPPAGGGNLHLQQKLEAATTDSIFSNSYTQVWGHKRGDRLIADVMVVTGKAVFQKKGGS